MTCGGSFPPARFAALPVTSIASSTASRGTADASTPSEIQSVSRPPATTPVCVIDADHAGPAPAAQVNTRPGNRVNQDQLRLSGIESGLHGCGNDVVGRLPEAQAEGNQSGRRGRSVRKGSDPH